MYSLHSYTTKAFYFLLAGLVLMSFVTSCVSFEVLSIGNGLVSASVLWILIMDMLAVLVGVAVYNFYYRPVLWFAVLLVLGVVLQVTSLATSSFFFDGDQIRQDYLEDIRKWDGQEDDVHSEMLLGLFKLQAEEKCCGVNNCTDYESKIPKSCCVVKSVKLDQTKIYVDPNCPYNPTDDNSFCNSPCGSFLEENEETAHFYFFLNMAAPLVFQVLLLPVMWKMYYRLKKKAQAPRITETPAPTSRSRLEDIPHLTFDVVDNSLSAKSSVVSSSRNRALGRTIGRVQSTSIDPSLFKVRGLSNTGLELTARGSEFGFNLKPLDQRALEKALRETLKHDEATHGRLQGKHDGKDKLTESTVSSLATSSTAPTSHSTAASARVVSKPPVKLNKTSSKLFHVSEKDDYRSQPHPLYSGHQRKF